MQNRIQEAIELLRSARKTIALSEETVRTAEQAINTIKDTIEKKDTPSEEATRLKKWLAEILYAAATNGNVELVNLLTQANVAANFKNEEGNTALMKACKTNTGRSNEVAMRLIDHKADVECENKKGMRPLMYAARQGNTALVLRLMEAKAKPEMVNHKRRSALDLVVKQDTAHYCVSIVSCLAPRTPIRKPLELLRYLQKCNNKHPHTLNAVKALVTQQQVLRALPDAKPPLLLDDPQLEEAKNFKNHIAKNIRELLKVNEEFLYDATQHQLVVKSVTEIVLNYFIPFNRSYLVLFKNPSNAPIDDWTTELCQQLKYS